MLAKTFHYRFNFLCNMAYTTSLYEVPGGCRTLSSDMTVVAPHLLYVEGFDVLTIPSGVQGHVVKIIDDNTALVRWKVSARFPIGFSWFYFMSSWSLCCLKN